MGPTMFWSELSHGGEPWIPSSGTAIQALLPTAAVNLGHDVAAQYRVGARVGK